MAEMLALLVGLTVFVIVMAIDELAEMLGEVEQ